MAVASSHVNPYALQGDWAWKTFHAFSNDENGDAETSDTPARDAEKPDSEKTPDEIISARIAQLKPDAKAVACKRCGSKIHWQDCYSQTNLHCENCNRPPSLAMVRRVFWLAEFPDSKEAAWLDVTEKFKPVMQREQMAAMKKQL